MTTYDRAQLNRITDRQKGWKGTSETATQSEVRSQGSNSSPALSDRSKQNWERKKEKIKKDPD